jgi:hypothetical protein
VACCPFTRPIEPGVQRDTEVGQTAWLVGVALGDSPGGVADKADGLVQVFHLHASAGLPHWLAASWAHLLDAKVTRV